MFLDGFHSAWPTIRFEGELAMLVAFMVLAWSRVRIAMQEQMYQMSLEPSELTRPATALSRATCTPKRILIVEDQAGLREILVHILERECYIVDAAGCLADARLALMIHDYDLLVLDLVLPDGSGYALLSWLKAAPGCPPPRILVLSHLTNVDDLLVGEAAEVDDYIGKPFEFEDLLHSVDRLLA